MKRYILIIASILLLYTTAFSQTTTIIDYTNASFSTSQCNIFSNDVTYSNIIHRTSIGAIAFDSSKAIVLPSKNPTVGTNIIASRLALKYNFITGNTYQIKITAAAITNGTPPFLATKFSSSVEGNGGDCNDVSGGVSYASFPYGTYTQTPVGSTSYHTFIVHNGPVSQNNQYLLIASLPSQDNNSSNRGKNYWVYIKKIEIIETTQAPPTIYSNVEKSQSFTRNNCGLGYQGSSVTYTVPAGKYTSTISQADADQKATNEINANGQNKANTDGNCVQEHNYLTLYSDFPSSSDIYPATIKFYQEGILKHSYLLTSDNNPRELTIPAGYYNVEVTLNNSQKCMVILHNGPEGGWWEEFLINPPDKTVISTPMYYYSYYNYVVLLPWN